MFFEKEAVSLGSSFLFDVVLILCFAIYYISYLKNLYYEVFIFIPVIDYLGMINVTHTPLVPVFIELPEESFRKK